MLRQFGLLPLAFLLLVACGDDDDDDNDSPRNPQLGSLVVDQAVLVPDFDSEIFDYTSEVANSVTTTTVTATTVNPAAGFTVNGVPVASGAPSQPVPLPEGDTTIPVAVTAENGTTQRTYTVVITRRPPPSSNAGLADLALDDGELDQLFDPAILDYTASVGYLSASRRVVATPEDSGATVEVAEAPAPPGEPSDYVPLEPGDNAVPVLVTAEDEITSQAYGITVTRASRLSLGQEAYLKASNTGPDNFGASVTVAADTLVVGAPDEGSGVGGIDGDGDDNTLSDAGAAYVFDRTGSGWVQTAYVKAAFPGDPDRFGAAMAMDGDLLLVGAPGEQSPSTAIDTAQDDDSSALVGAAYAFVRDANGDWRQDAYLKAANAQQGDQFGTQVAFNGQRGVVGAPFEDSDATGVDGDGDNDNRTGAGAAYVFARDETGRWAQQAYLKASNTNSDDEFGTSVAISGGVAAVGARYEDSDATGVDGDDADDSRPSAGAVYLFEDLDGDGIWSPAAYIKASNTDAGDEFGTAVALSGNLLAVGAPGENSASGGIDGDQDDNTLDRVGAVYVFERDPTGVWSQIAYVKAATPAFGDEFGSALALEGGLLAVAARAENSAATGIDGDSRDNSALNAGAVYLFERGSTGDWAQIAYVKASNTDAQDDFGSGLALGGGTLVVGAESERSADPNLGDPQADNSLPEAGAAYVFR